AVNLPDASASGIAVARTTGANAEAVAEMAMAMIMAAKRQLLPNRSVTNSGVWGAKMVGGEMRGKKLGLVGFGMIARLLAKLFSGFEVEVLAYDPFLDAESMKKAGARKVELKELFQEADAISIHIPYTDEAYHLVNADLLGLMKKNAVIICTARGNIVDEDALYEAIRDRKILGAGLDVYAQEPLPATSPLLKLGNAVLTPHVAAQTEDALWAMYKKAIDIAADFFEGKDLGRDLLNPDYKKA
ncbi:MAG: phosphoglycerate dehydrogenase, partial [Oscillibacter sp.]|nr:phosphoglycerate dehydrogenase [Oscillibacter sp.]